MRFVLHIPVICLLRVLLNVCRTILDIKEKVKTLYMGIKSGGLMKFKKDDIKDLTNSTNSAINTISTSIKEGGNDEFNKNVSN